MSDLLNKASAAASQAYAAASDTVTQALNSETAKNLGTQAQNIAGQVGQQVAAVAGQVHEQAHAAAPSVVPAPGTAAKPVTGAVGDLESGIDKTDDLEPASTADRQKFEKLFDNRPSPQELKDRGILKGEPGDALAGKRQELEKSMQKDRLDKEIGARPTRDDLIAKGILSPEDADTA